MATQPEPLGRQSKRVLIWGTGEAGKNAYRKLRDSVQLIGFVDNDRAKAGTHLYDLRVYSPDGLKDLEYDRIVVASMYHAEITAQLITELGVPVTKIDVAPPSRFRLADSGTWWGSWRSRAPDYSQWLESDHEVRRACLAARYYLDEPLLEHHVMYESYNGRDFAGNPYALFKYLLHHPDYQHLYHVIGVDDVNHPKLAPFRAHPRVTIVQTHSDEYIRCAETCKYFINNVSFKPYIIKREGQIYVNSWHSTLLKKLAADTRRVWEAKQVARALLATDYFISPNRYTTKLLFRSHGVDSLFQGVVAEIGYPRNDLIFHTDKSKLRQRLGIPENKKLVLFAPTWRGQYVPRNTVPETLGYYRYLTDNLPEDYFVLVKFHTMVYPFLNDEALAVSAPRDVDTNELLSVTDLLVTDYSGIFFDFLITGNPVIFFTPDREAYSLAKTGFYLDIEQLPGSICDRIEDVVDCIIRVDDVRMQYAKRYEEFQKRFVSADDGHACARVVDLVFNGQTYPNVYRPRTDKKKILIYPGGLASNGVTTSFLALLEYLDYDSYNVVVLLPTDNAARHLQQQIDPRAKVFYQTTVDGFTEDEYERVRRLASAGLDAEDPVVTAAYLRNMRRIFADVQFDTVINFNGYDAQWTAKLRFGLDAKRWVIYLHNDLNEDRKIKNPGLHGVFSLYRFYDKLICVSEDSLQANIVGMANYVRETFGFDVSPKMDYVRNPILPDKIRARAQEVPASEEGDHKYYVVTNPISTEPSQTYSYRIPFPTPDYVNFITIGRLFPEKNQLRLLHAFHEVQQELTNVRLYIVGQGVMMSQLSDFVQEHGLESKVVFVHHLTNPYPLLALCDCFVLSSDIEGQPVVILEALTLGKYIIATDIPGPRNLLRNGEGVLVAPSSRALAQAMKDFIRGGRHSKQRPFDPYAYVDHSMQQFYEKVLNEPRRAASVISTSGFKTGEA